MNSKTRLIAVASVAPLAFSISVRAQTLLRNAGLSASGSPIPSASPGSAACNRPLPFHGMVSAVDQKNKSFTISGKGATRVFKVTSKTQLLKGATAAMKDIIDNEEVSGSYWRNTDGSLEANVIKLGPVEKKATGPAVNASPSTPPNASATPES